MLAKLLTLSGNQTRDFTSQVFCYDSWNSALLSHWIASPPPSSLSFIELLFIVVEGPYVCFVWMSVFTSDHQPFLQSIPDQTHHGCINHDIVVGLCYELLISLSHYIHRMTQGHNSNSFSTTPTLFLWPQFLRPYQNYECPKFRPPFLRMPVFTTALVTT